MLDDLPNTPAGWKYFSRIFLEAFTSSTETFDLRDQLKQLVWNPEKVAIKHHLLTMTTILHFMALLGDHLTDRDKVEYFMSSLVNKSYVVENINLSKLFDQACRDVIEFVSKERIATTIMNQHEHRLLPGVKFNNIEPFDEEYDFETMSRYRAGSPASRRHDFPSDRNLDNMELFAMQMDLINKLTPEEKRRFGNQLCIGCGQAGHVWKECPTYPRIFTRPARPFQPQRPAFQPQWPVNNNTRHNGDPQHNMGV
jgi:hypothetical protein